MEVTSSVDIENIEYEDGLFTVQARLQRQTSGCLRLLAALWAAGCLVLCLHRCRLPFFGSVPLLQGCLLSPACPDHVYRVRPRVVLPSNSGGGGVATAGMLERCARQLRGWWLGLLMPRTLHPLLYPAAPAVPQVLTDYEALPRVFHNVETSQARQQGPQQRSDCHVLPLAAQRASAAARPLIKGGVARTVHDSRIHPPLSRRCPAVPLQVRHDAASGNKQLVQTCKWAFLVFRCGWRAHIGAPAGHGLWVNRAMLGVTSVGAPVAQAPPDACRLATCPFACAHSTALN